MTTLEIILIAIIWIFYGIFNSYQHDWHKDYDYPNFVILLNILFSPLALMIRIVRGVFYWNGKY